MALTQKRLYRSQSDRIVAGICGGLAEYFDIDPVLVRIIFAILLFSVQGFFLVYLLGWFLIPDKSQADQNKKKSTKEQFEQTSEEIQAQAHNFVDKTKDMLTPDSSGRSNLTMGIILIAIGSVFLINQFLPNFLQIDKLWPVLPILAGFYIIIKQD